MPTIEVLVSELDRETKVIPLYVKAHINQMRRLGDVRGATRQAL